jgi:predicted nuclease of predicted toxin-antitoxin system
VKLLADEGAEAPTVTRLRSDGHDVTHDVTELAPGIADDAVLELANAEERVLLTTDKDFGELVFRLRRLPLGVLLLRLAGIGQEARAEIVSQVIAAHGEQMTGAFTVVSPAAVRIRAQGDR